MFVFGANQARGGLGRVCVTEMDRSIEHVEFPKFQTGIFVEWKRRDKREVILGCCVTNSHDDCTT